MSDTTKQSVQQVIDDSNIEVLLTAIKEAVKNTEKEIKINGFTLTETTTLDDIGVPEALKEAIQDALNELPKPENPFKFVDQMPSSGDEGILYLVKKDGEGTNGNKYDEYIYHADTEEFERVGEGTIEVDLTNYVTTESLEEWLGDYAKSDDVEETYAKKTDLNDYLKTDEANFLTDEDIADFVTDAAVSAIVDARLKGKNYLTSDDLEGYATTSEVSAAAADAAASAVDTALEEGGYVTNTDVDEKLKGKADATHSHSKSDVGLDKVDNTSDLEKPISTAVQEALNGKASSDHTHTKDDVGLGSVDNTSDADKPISTAVQKALDAKAASNHTHTFTATDVGLGNVNNTSDAEKPVSNATQTELNKKAPLESPAFTGTPTAPKGDVKNYGNTLSSQQIATQQWVAEYIKYNDYYSGPVPSLTNYYSYLNDMIPGKDDFYTIGGYVDDNDSKARYQYKLVSAKRIATNPRKDNKVKSIEFEKLDDVGNYYAFIGANFEDDNIVNTINNRNMLIIGHYHSSKGYGSLQGTDGMAFIIGNGAGSGTAGYFHNAFSVDYNGNVSADGKVSSSGSDYAEFVEWEDGNPNNEDRVGHFITLVGNKMRFANPGDDIHGIISANPSIVGNNDGNEWYDKFLRDNFGRRFTKSGVNIMETDDGPKEIPYTSHVENPEYDPTKEYISREDRAEYDYVGMVGRLRVYDDGTCVENGYCKVADGGIATAATREERSFTVQIFKVMKRITDNIIEVWLLTL